MSRRSTSGSTFKAAAAASRRTRSGTASRPATAPACRRRSRSRRRRSATRDCTPEEADTITAGFVVEPQQTGLQFSIDWYDIDLSDAIGQLGVQRIVNECRAAPGSQFCDYVFRDPGTNAVTAVRNPWLNINNARVRGLDYELLWNRDMDLFGNRSEALTLRFLAGRLLEDSTTTPGAAARRSVGPAQRAGDREPWRRCAISSASGASACRSATSARARSTSATISFIQFVPGVVPGAGRTYDRRRDRRREGLHRSHGQLRPRAQQRPRVAVGARDHERGRRGPAGDPDVRSAVQLADEPRQRLRRVRTALPGDVQLPAVAPLLRRTTSGCARSRRSARFTTSRPTDMVRRVGAASVLPTRPPHTRGSRAQTTHARDAE